jgi:hypothetical protein
MPYIADPNRETLDPFIEELSQYIENTGDLNYVVTRLALKHLLSLGLNYGNFDAVIGVFLCAQAEMYRRVGAVYEELKIKQNGDVPEYSQIETQIRRQAMQLPIKHAADTEQAHG